MQKVVEIRMSARYQVQFWTVCFLNACSNEPYEKSDLHNHKIGTGVNGLHYILINNNNVLRSYMQFCNPLLLLKRSFFS